ncbi:MAG: hypothetical protein NC548_45450 [Lachnospiraceae bacterium]|nr:hypothetical protein [Lachnospiraceae bacterium]
MKANTDKAENGAEIYAHKIKALADEYINTLDNPDDIYNNNTLFNGMIKYIYINYFKHNKIDYGDIEYLDNLWNIYTSLCYKYNKYPTIIEYCLMININRETITSWKNGDTREYIYYTMSGERIKDLPGWKLGHPGEEYRQESSAKHSNTVKKWLAECENNLFRGAAEGNKVGCIFALKANYGYTETAPIPVQNPHQIASRTPEEIAAGYGVAGIEDKGGLPEVPE